MCPRQGEAAGRALCARHRVRAREYGLVRTCTDLYGPSFAGGFGGQAGQGAVRAMYFGNFRSAWRNAQGAGKECRTCRTGRTGRTIGTGCSESHVLPKFQSAWHTACHSPFIVFPEFIVFIASLPAPCALRNVLCQSSGGSKGRKPDSRPSRSGTMPPRRKEYGVSRTD